MKYAFNLILRGLVIMGILVAMEWKFLVASSLITKVFLVIIQWMVIMIVQVIIDIMLLRKGF